MQLVAYGAQDVYLTGNPQITFFKVVYRRHTNFSMETIEHTLNGNPDFGRKSSVLITRNGDLATKMYLRVVLNQWTPDDGVYAGWVRRVGHALIDNVEVEIGGSRIDKQYGTWLDIWYELARPAGDGERGYLKMIGDTTELTNVDGNTKPEYTLFIPLQFWFNRNTGLALPLIALQYHEVRLHFEFRRASELVVQDTTSTPQSSKLSMLDASLLVDYIYLDSEERRRFAQVGHEYLIEQLQFTGTETVNEKTRKIKLGFNHPTKELVWAMRNGTYITGKYFLAYTNGDDWSVAVEAAAKHLICCMFVAGDGSNSVGTSTDLNDGAAAFPDLSTALTCGIALSGTVPAAGTGYFDDGRTYTVCGRVLNDQITSASVCVLVEAGDFSGVECKSVCHNLSLRDLSFPTDDSNVVDARDPSGNGDDNSACVNRDVCVFQWHNFGLLLDGSYNPVSTALIQLNGHDRFDVREGNYFNYVQPDQHHTNTPADGINVYSFALHPEQHQPSGTANLSRIDNTQLNISFLDTSRVFVTHSVECDIPFLNDDSELWVFALSYNVLRVMSGMAGTAYSN